MEQKNMTGILSKNDKKTQQNHPDYKGNATINGDEYWLSAWIKQGKKAKFMSFAFTPKESQIPENEQIPEMFEDNDIPF